ncbi:hypothetical protein QQY79_01540 [Flavobacterium tructae]|uniref:hypothetical protein n=1 Tax=Flavobacterium tructae TaxID=1114873 RepID=UPI002551E3A6|nr:hypothetical protein [Flavobacterium tructae]MDL2141188.1 hypothetical protein [Flavobacterium tructae]
MIDKSVNAGVDAQTGFALQRNTALYLLLNNYNSKFKEKKYFICLEHHDDFLFCFIDENNKVISIDAYQSKKKSPSKWTLNAEMFEVLSKLLGTGKKLIEDDIPKTNNYQHTLHFSTNQTITLECGSAPNKTTLSIKEDRTLVSYEDLDNALKEKIKEKIDSKFHDELDNLHFYWIDLNKTVKYQEAVLILELIELVGDKVSSPKSGIQTLISVFNKIEYIYNQGNNPKLLDVSKRISNKQIEEVLEIITTKSKAFEDWRNEKSEIASAIKIRPFEREIFEEKFSLAFDFFKSNEEAEHQKILKFVKLNYLNCVSTTLGDTVIELNNLFLKLDSTLFNSLDLKATIYAAYFEATLKTNN